MSMHNFTKRERERERERESPMIGQINSQTGTQHETTDPCEQVYNKVEDILGRSSNCSYHVNSVSPHRERALNGRTSLLWVSLWCAKWRLPSNNTHTDCVEAKRPIQSDLSLHGGIGVEKSHHHSYLTNQHAHSTWASHPIWSASDSSSLQQSTNPTCLQEQMTITKARILQPPLLRQLFFFSIFLHGLPSFCSLFLF